MMNGYGSLRDRQAQTHSPVISAAMLLNAVERTKDLVQFRFRHARSVVSYANYDFCIFAGEFHIDGGALWRVTEGIADQVLDSAMQ
jgi:hypothetical protein